MKFTKKFISLILCAAISLTTLFCGVVSAAAATVSVSSYQDIQEAIASGSLDGATISLDSDITAGGDISFEDIQDLTIALNGHTLSLSDYTLTFSNTGDTSIVGGATAVIGGTITANNNAVCFSGTSGILTVENNVVISSENANALVNNSEGLRVVLTGAQLYAENGCGVLLKSDADSGAELIFTVGDYSSSKISAKKCVGAYSTAGDNVQAVNSTVKIAYGARLFGEKIFDTESGLLTVTSYSSSSSYAISMGTYSENISQVYSIPIRSKYSILHDGENFTVFKNTAIKSITDEASFINALKKSGAYKLTADFTVSEPVTVSADADVIITGNGYEVAFDNNGRYLSVENGVDYRLTFSNISIEGNGVGSFYSQSVSSLNDLKAGSVYLFDSTIENFSSFMSYECVAENDIYLDHTINLTSSEKLELDLNGKTITVQDGVSPAFSVNGFLVIKDTAGSGRVIADNLVSKSENAKVAVCGGTFSKNVYDYTARDKSVFNIVNDDKTDTVYSSESVLYDAMSKEPDDPMTEDNLANLKTLGYQIKAGTTTDKGNDINTHGIRIITVVNEGLIKSANIKEYGYVVAKYTGDKELKDLKLNQLTASVGNGQKVIPANKTSNTLWGNYGKYSTDTKYKYVTLAVNGLDENEKIVSRFYIKTTDGKTYYSKYDVYDGILADYNVS